VLADALTKCVHCGKEIGAAPSDAVSTPIPAGMPPASPAAAPTGKMEDHSVNKPTDSQKMKKFYCLGLDAFGKKAEGTFFAHDQEAAAKMVLKQGYRIELLHEVLTKEQIEFKKLIGKLDIILFYTAIVAAIVIGIIIFTMVKK